jgi:hypothetical protein
MPRRNGTDAPLLAARDVAVVGRFLAKRDKIATDISGIATATALGEQHLQCLVIDNETLWAQHAVLDLGASTLIAGDLVRLLPEDRDAIDAVGRPPDDGDPGPDEYILDAEGVAWLPPWYYVAGSHSIHDHADQGVERSDYRRSAHLVARTDSRGRRVELSYRLNRVLERHDAFRRHFLRSPNKARGLNIEGLAASGRRLYFGFRMPVIDGSALILSVRAEALFMRGAELAPKVMRVPLGKDTGIRDMAALPDGRFVILAGPANDDYAGFSIVLFDRRRDKTRTLGLLPAYNREKVEGLLLAGYETGKATLLTFSDHPANGNPRLFTVDIPPP